MSWPGYDHFGWRPPAEALTFANEDGLKLLLVDGKDHPLSDASGLVVTIGYAQHVDGDEWEWSFAGWCWSHDHFTQGTGKVVAWQPLPFPLSVEPADVAELLEATPIPR